MTINTLTGILYLDQERKNATTLSGVRTFDGSVISPVDTPSESTTGMLDGSNDNEYTGSVKEGSRNYDFAYLKPLDFNPNFSNSDNLYRGGIVRSLLVSSGTSYFFEFVPQGVGCDWGEIEEGSTSVLQNDAAVFAQYTIGGLGTLSGTHEGLGYLDRRQSTGGTMVDRYVSLIRYTTNTRDFGLYLWEASTADPAGASNTAYGSRTATCPGRVMNYWTHFAGLVPDIADIPCDLDVMPVGGDDFDVYFLSYGGGLTYLSAVRATLPADKTGWSWEQIDLSGSEEDGILYLQLRDTVADKDIAGQGLAMGGDGTMYVASEATLSTGNSAFDDARIYIFDMAVKQATGTVILVK
jgi:hypothetical protein